MENMIKPETNLCLKKLQDAEFATIMATGDNGLTAISVGRNCGIIDTHKPAYVADKVTCSNGKKVVKWTVISSFELDTEEIIKENTKENFEDNKTNGSSNSDSYDLSYDSQDYHEILIDPKCGNRDEKSNLVSEKFPWDEKLNCDFNQYEYAISGAAFEMLLKEIYNPNTPQAKAEMLKRIVLHTKVFSRMSPDHKAMLVNELQKAKDHMVAMCGDGANDCKALKAADVGLSLSEAEASIAAPFTSKIPNISPIIKLFREGRASLVTSFQLFKFIALTSLIQFTSTISLYSVISNLTSWQYLFVDLFVVFPSYFTMSKHGASKDLGSKMPISKLISSSVMTSVILQTLIQAVVQVSCILLLKQQSWYVSRDTFIHQSKLRCMENSVIFLVSIILYMNAVLMYSYGSTFRKPISTNKLMIGGLAFSVTFTCVIILNPPEYFTSLFELVEIPLDFKMKIVQITIASLGVSMIVEKFIRKYLE
uniref:Cation-transporting P-type ATPase C-terminal domain-containing protein n=1 Tax=Euplotes harpa TaxID=151035 RepID=A0A7S3J4W7_9SPIT